MKLYALIFVAAVTLCLGSVRTSFAYQVPQFTSCLNPSGTVRANYETGTHGIPGKTASYQGKDTVYNLSGNELTQCFCASNGSGIQTNWWKVSLLTESEVNGLKSQGWVYVPNGALWGLENVPYLAFNSDYSCKGSQGSCCSSTTDIPGPGGGGGGQGGSGNVLGISTGSVLGLASTGNIKFLLTVLFGSVGALILGILLKLRVIKLSK